MHITVPNDRKSAILVELDDDGLAPDKTEFAGERTHLIYEEQSRASAALDIVKRWTDEFSADIT